MRPAERVRYYATSNNPTLRGSTMDDMRVVLEHWQLDTNAEREQMDHAPTPRERERWHAVWLLARGWSAAEVTKVLERDAHTIGAWVDALEQKGPTGLTFE